MTAATNKQRAPRLPGAGEPLIWQCAECHELIADGTGYLHLDEDLLRAAEKARAAWEAANPGPILTGDALMSIPRRAPWRARHAACDPYPNAADYWFDVARARTYKALLSWSAHLSAKNWIKHTDWFDLMTSIAGGGA